MDDTDSEILSLLSGDGRLSFRELGAAVHLSSNAVAERFRRLQKEGVIRAIRAEIDPVVMGRTLEALVEVKMNTDVSARDFEDTLRRLPQVVSATLMTGAFDYTLRVACTSREDLMDLIEDLRRSGAVRDTQTRIILREVALATA